MAGKLTTTEKTATKPLFTPQIKSQYDVVIVGAGAAGMATAITLAGSRLRVAVFDEASQPGGQIYRNLESNSSRVKRILGRDYRAGQRLIAKFRASVDKGNIEYHGDASVWFVDEGCCLGVLKNGCSHRIIAKKLVFATGCQERPMPIPGWHLPGVMTAGAGQILLKSDAMVPDQVVLAGAGPLLWLLAYQYKRAGVKIEGLLDISVSTIKPSRPIMLKALLAFEYLLKGAFLMAYAKLMKLPVFRNAEAIQAHKNRETGALESVTFTSEGEYHQIDTPLLFLHHGVIPGVQMAEAAGCKTVWDEPQQAWLPEVSFDGVSSNPNVSILGDASGIEGAKAAAISGKIVGLRLAHELRVISRSQFDLRSLFSRWSRKRHLSIRPLLHLLFPVASDYLTPADDVIVCRCEEVTAGQVREAAKLGCMGPNQVKTFTRCGMGPCQGRMCGSTVEQIMADELKKSPTEVGRYRTRPPLKPITLGQLAKS